MPRLDKKGDFASILGADALHEVLGDTTIAAYRGVTRGIERGARVLRRAVRKKNFGWKDERGKLRRSVRLAKVKGFRVNVGGRSIRIRPYATVVLGDYRPRSKTYAPHAHLVARGYVKRGRGGARVRGKFPLQRAFVANFPAIRAAITGSFDQDFTREMGNEIRRVYRGQLRKLLRGERTL